MTPFSTLLDLKLEQLGWTDRNRAFDDMIAATIARDNTAYYAAKARFYTPPRDGSAAQEAAPSNSR
jgi:hypothetical protein